MATNVMRNVQSERPPPPDEDLLLRELSHRCSNDLQMVVGLLAMQSRRVQSEEARIALTDATERVAVLARSRAMLQRKEPLTLESALQQVCAALQSQAEPRGILISLTVSKQCDGLSQQQVTTLALIVNELVTNAVKHAFHEGKGGCIRICVQEQDSAVLTITVDDDGTPFMEAMRTRSGGLGLDLVTRLMGGVGGILIPPTDGSKVFEMRVPRTLHAQHLGS